MDYHPWIFDEKYLDWLFHTREGEMFLYFGVCETET